MDVRSCWPFPHRPAWLLGFSLLSALVSLSAEAQPPRRTPATPVSLWALPISSMPIRPRQSSLSLWAMATPAVPKPTAVPATARTLGPPADRWPLSTVPQRRSGPAWRRILLPGQPVAAPYWPVAERHAACFGLNPALVLAVIHVESNGNPAAISPKNARGLMQLVPTAGGREAWRLLTGDPAAGPPTPVQLADPDNNMRPGDRRVTGWPPT
ncbi:MAG: transglycosylase SLT domain-containing protein [Candidatus Competibacteraceae bacterium]